MSGNIDAAVESLLHSEMTAEEALAILNCPALDSRYMRTENELMRSALSWLRQNLRGEFVVARSDGEPMAPDDMEPFVQWFGFVDLVLSKEHAPKKIEGIA